jgi:hypothetical protein
MEGTMNREQALVAFEQHSIRRFFDEANETWYFSVIDVVAALTDSVNARDYWFKMKIRVKTEGGLELSTICRQLKMKAPDGKGKNRGAGSDVRRSSWRSWRALRDERPVSRQERKGRKGREGQ